MVIQRKYKDSKMNVYKRHKTLNYLLPCPFCGSDDLISLSVTIYMDGTVDPYRIKCDKCGAFAWSPVWNERKMGNET